MYRKNTAGQFVCFQGVDATTGGIKSGVTWTMRRCIDGTFAAGGGTVTEDSTNGWYKCALAQADTNGNNISFNFTGTGAVPQTVNIITDGSPPDVNLKNILGTVASTPATAGILDINVKNINNVAAATPGAAGGVLIAGTNAATSITTALTANIIGNVTGNLSGTVGSVTGAVGSVTARVTANTDQLAGQTVTAAAGVTFPTSVASPTNITAGTITTVTNLTNAPTAGDFTATMKTSIGTAVAASAVASVTAGVTVTTNNDKTGYTIASGGIPSGAHAAAELNNIADATLDRNMATGVDSGTDSTAVRTMRQALRAVRNKVSISGGTVTVTKEDDATASWTGAVATSAGNPISSVDPT